jgi:hypothetical protein
MMKQLTGLLLLTTPAAVFAHPGHLANEQVHGFLHTEYIVVLLAFIGLVYFVNFIRNK